MPGRDAYLDGLLVEGEEVEEWWQKQNPYGYGLDLPPLRTTDDFVSAIICDDVNVINFCLWEARQNPSMLEAVFQALAVVPRPSFACREAFHGAWVTQGLWIRDAFSIDTILLDVFVNLLPGYSGPPMELFRGERWSNHEAGTYGPSWTTDCAKAETFAGGLNCCPRTGGVLLRTIAPASSILAGPNAHSQHLGEFEFIVDRRSLKHVEVLATYPPGAEGT
jgi:hypothetical protein